MQTNTWPRRINRRDGDSGLDAFARTLIDRADSATGDATDSVYSWMIVFTDADRAEADALAKRCGLAACPVAFIATMDIRGEVCARAYDDAASARAAWNGIMKGAE